MVTEKATIAENNLAAANAALGALVAERIKNQELWSQVEAANGINLPQLLTNSVIDGLRARRNALVTEYEEKLETFKPGYPAMVQIKNKIAEIDRQLAAEVMTIKASFKAAYESSAQSGRRDAQAHRHAEGGGAGPAEAQHSVQHPEARGGHQPLAL